MGIVSILALPIILRRRLSRTSGWAAEITILSIGNMARMLLFVFVFAGPGLAINVPGTRINGIFFAEWQFMEFLVYVALPFSLISSVVYLVSRRNI